MNIPALASNSFIGRIARLPLALVPRDMVVPILRGKLRGKCWIVRSAIHRCWLGFYEYKKQRLICKEVRPNTVFFDVGANVGFYSLLASKLLGQGKVYAFEPLSRNLEYLEKHLALNCATNVEVLGLAVSDTNGSATFAIEPTGFMGRLADEGDVTVPTATLDSLVEAGRILPPDYIKMDIEGAELLALRGASKIFQRHHPVLFLATHGRQVHTECIRLLHSWGYSCSPLDDGDSGELRELVARFRS